MFGVLSTLPCRVGIEDHQHSWPTPRTAPRAGASGSQTDPGQGCGRRTCRGSTWEWPQWPPHSPPPHSSQNQALFILKGQVSNFTLENPFPRGPF